MWWEARQQRLEDKPQQWGAPCPPRALRTLFFLPWQLLLSLKSSCLTADSDSGAKRRPVAGQCHDRGPGVLGRPEMLHAPTSASPFPSHLHQLGDVLHHRGKPSPVPSAWSAKTGTTGLPPAPAPWAGVRGSGSFTSVAMQYQPLVMPAPSRCPWAVLPPTDGNTGCSPLPCSCSARAEPAPRAPLAASPPPQLELP